MRHFRFVPFLLLYALVTNNMPVLLVILTPGLSLRVLVKRSKLTNNLYTYITWNSLLNIWLRLTPYVRMTSEEPKVAEVLFGNVRTLRKCVWTRFITSG